MDIGIPIPNVTPPISREAVEQIARAADDLGFHSVWLGDHVARPDTSHYVSGDTFSWDLYEAYVTAGFVAAITKRTRIAFGVVVLPYRNPLMQAKMIATLDHLSNGRMLFGAGAGGLAGEFAALGVSLHERGARTDEYLQAFRVLWSDERPVFHGKYVNVENVWFKPKPIQDPLPIWIGGHSDAAMRRALRYGQGWHAARLGVDELRPFVERLRALAAEEGRGLADFPLSCRPTVILHDRPIDAASEEVTSKAALTGEALIGPPEYLAERMARYETELGVTHLTLDIYDWWTGLRDTWQIDDPVRYFLNTMETIATKVVPLLPPPRLDPPTRPPVSLQPAR